MSQPGDYLLIQPATFARHPVTIGESGGNNNGDQYWTIDRQNLRISWIHSSWHEVQDSNGNSLSPACQGGDSCTVQSAGNYVFIRHGNDGDRYNVQIGQ